MSSFAWNNSLHQCNAKKGFVRKSIPFTSSGPCGQLMRPVAFKSGLSWFTEMLSSVSSSKGRQLYQLSIINC